MGSTNNERTEVAGGREQGKVSGFPRSLDGIIVIDARGDILEWNKGEEEITGIPRAEALGQPLWEIQYRLVPREKRNSAYLEIAKEKIYRGLKEGDRLRRVLENEIECPNGIRRTIQSVIFSIPGEEGILACGVSRDVTENKRVEQEQAGLLERLTLEITRAEDEERRRVAEILHAEVQQELSAAQLHLALLAERLKNDAALEAMAGKIREMVAAVLQTTRTLSHDLSPPALSENDLFDALEWLAERMKEQHGLTVDMRRCERIRLESRPLLMFLFRAAQEMLFNVVKHARALEAEVGARHRCDRICLFVIDQGSGFDARSLGKTRGYGISNIRQRARLLGGRLGIRSRAGKGSFLLLSVPDRPREAAWECDKRPR